MANNLNFSRVMKSKHIKKETAKRLRLGFHTDLMNVFEEAVDLYGENEFERGYQSFFGDARVHAERIAKAIDKRFRVTASMNDLTEVIEEYFESLKTE